MEKSPGYKLGLISLAYIIISLLAAFTGRLYIFYISVMVAGIYFLFNFKNEIMQRDIFVSVILASMAGLYGIITGNYIMGSIVIIMGMCSYMGSVPVFRKYISTNKVLGDDPKKSIGLGIILGLVLGAFNILIAGASINPKFALDALFLALQAGIWEEVAMRFLFYAIGVYIFKREGQNRLENILIYILMVIPHLLAHGMMGIGSLIVLFLLFGLPMAILQRKVDLTSAIIMHSTVDLIRFVCLGI